MRKFIKWVGVVLLTPVVLFLILFVLLYIPPIQNFLVGKATTYASVKTGMKIGIERISLSFPLNLVVKGVEVVSRQDTLLSVDRLQINIQLLPLLRREVEVDGIELRKAKVNSMELIKGMTIRGTLGEFYIESHGVDLGTEEAIINKAFLKDTHLNLCLNDTAKTPRDSASAPVLWKFALQKLNLQNVSFALQMPVDSLSLLAEVNNASLKNGHVDLEKEAYRLGSLEVKNAMVRYDSGNGQVRKGFDPSHIVLRDMQIALDSLKYQGRVMGAVIQKLSMRERSGLEVVSLKGKVYSDGTSITVPHLTLETQHSNVELVAMMDWSVVKKINNGGLSVNLAADIGKQDVLLFAGDLPDEFERAYPLRPLIIRTRAKGNIQRLNLEELKCELPGAFVFSATGFAEYLLDSLRRSGKVDFGMETKKLDFVLAMMSSLQRKRFAIPQGILLRGNGIMNASRYETGITLTEKSGKLLLTGMYDNDSKSYEADLVIDNLQLHHFMPEDSLYALTASVNAKGRGFDFFSPRTTMQAGVAIHDFQYGHYGFSGIRLDASLSKSVASVSFESTNPLLNVQANLEAWLSKRNIRANLDVNALSLDWYGLHLVKEPFKSSLRFSLEAETNLRDMYKLEGNLKDLCLISPKKTYKPKDLYFSASTNIDSTKADIRAGDMDIVLQAQGPLDRLIKESARFSAQLMEQIKNKKIDQSQLKKLLPASCLRISVGKDNPLSSYLAMSGIGFNDFLFDMDTSPENGMNGKAYVYSLHTDSLQLDTIQLSIRQDTTEIKLFAGITNTPGNKQFVFTATAEGAIYENSGELLLKYLNGKGETGVLLGIRAVLEEDGIGFHLFPEQPTVVFRPFTLNKNNYIFLRNDKHMAADIQLFDKNGTGLRIYSLEDTVALQDIALELRQVDLEEVMEVVPYMPDIRGMLTAEAHYIQTESSLQVAADVKVDGLTYEKEVIGDVTLGGVYLPGEKNAHYLDAYLNHNGTEVMTMGGVYHTVGNGSLDADMKLEHFPLNIANAFIPENYAELSGDMDGELKIEGELKSPKINGKFKLDSASVFIAQAGARFRFDEEPIRIESNKLIFDDFDIYTQGKNPFAINGNIDFSDFSRMTADLKLDAVDYELLNAPRTKESLVYGKVFVDFNSTVRGPLNALVMRGNITLQGNTDITYVLKDSPLTVQNRLGDLVTFVNFNDTTQQAKEDMPTLSLGGLDMLMTIRIDPAVKLKVDLSADRESRVELEGGGDLSLQYTPQGDLMLSGRYTLVSGLLKYALSFISKTFTIQNGSYVDWTGNVMNPTLNITALERVRASVAQDNQSPRTVNFDVSIAIKNQLQDLSLVFNLDAPEDGAVQNQLSAVGAEERGKLAVAMLATGMYLGTGNSSGSGLNMGNAMNAFLQQQIASLAGSALSKVDITLGVETNDGSGTDGSGKQTDVSFRFARKFWNNRLSVIIGGKISTGENVQNSAQSFIDNVALEWRLDNTGTRYIKLFHDINYESILEGEITETGIGVVLRRKMSKLGQLFIFRKPKSNLKANEYGGSKTK